MMTNIQLNALISYIRAEAQSHARYIPCTEHEVRAARRGLCEAFGFEAHKNGYPKTPEPHPQTLPPARRECKCSPQDVHDYGPCDESCFSLATSDPEGHRQLLADLDHAAKHEAITALLAERKACNFTYHAKASDIMRLWSELKAIMEPGSMCIDQLVKMEKTDDHK